MEFQVLVYVILKMECCFFCTLSKRIFDILNFFQFPAHEWGTCPYWGKYRDIDFNDVMQLANEELTFIKHTHKTLEQQ